MSIFPKYFDFSQTLFERVYARQSVSKCVRVSDETSVWARREQERARERESERAREPKSRKAREREGERARATKRPIKKTDDFVFPSLEGCQM